MIYQYRCCFCNKWLVGKRRMSQHLFDVHAHYFKKIEYKEKGD